MFATIAPPPNRLLVFARLPEQGKVKTRLAAEVGDERALAIYSSMLRDVLELASLVADEAHEVEVLWAPTETASAATLQRAFGDHTLAMQAGHDLGERMCMAFSERFFFHRTRKIVAIGVDDPTLPRELIDRAFALLDSCEWVLGPASDGGYYMIGCRALSFDSDVFRGIEWGTSSVLAATLAKIAELKQSVALLPERSDIDTAADLERSAWHKMSRGQR